MCLGYNDSRVIINIEDIHVEDSYDGPRLEKSTSEIDSKWVQSLMKYQKERKVLHKKYACMIINKAKEIYEKV
jgi:serine/threonine-protein phosphatase 5